MGMLDDLILAIGDIGGQFSRGLAGGFTQRQEEEGQLRRQKRAFETLEPLQTEAALQRRRKEFELERELGAPRREQFAKYVNPLIGEAYGEGVLPTPPEALPSPERAEFETPDYRQYLEGLDPDLALMLLRHTESKRKQDAAQEQRDMANLFRQMGLGFQQQRLDIQKEKAEKPPAPSLERDLEAEAIRQGIPPEQRFEWKQKQRAIAAGQKAEAVRPKEPPPRAEEDLAIKALVLLDKNGVFPGDENFTELFDKTMEGLRAGKSLRVVERTRPRKTMKGPSFFGGLFGEQPKEVIEQERYKDIEIGETPGGRTRGARPTGGKVTRAGATKPPASPTEDQALAELRRLVQGGHSRESALDAMRKAGWPIE
jgi:hypothetical protein